MLQLISPKFFTNTRILLEVYYSHLAESDAETHIF